MTLRIEEAIERFWQHLHEQPPSNHAPFPTGRAFAQLFDFSCPILNKTIGLARQKTIRVMLVTLVAFVLAPPVEGITRQQMKISFESYINRAEVLTNFPVLVVFSNNVGGNSAFNYRNFASPYGYDLRFATDARPTTNGLHYEIESWNTNGASYVWVQVPTIPTNGSGAIWANWGNTSATNQLSCTTNGAVWTNGYLSIWHMARTNGALSLKDSTTNQYTISAVGTLSSVSTGKIDGACQFSATYGSCSDIPALNNASQFTVSLWFNRPSYDVSQAFFSKRNQAVSQPDKYDILFAIDSSRNLFMQVDNGADGSAAYTLPADYPSNTWIHAVGVFDGTLSDNTNRLKIYLNGAQQTLNFGSWTVPATTPNLPGIAQLLGSYVGVWQLNGQMDQIELSSSPRSADWIWASYQNMASNTTFNLYGTVSTLGGGTVIMLR